jgi:hypothetical protein
VVKIGGLSEIGILNTFGNLEGFFQQTLLVQHPVDGSIRGKLNNSKRRADLGFDYPASAFSIDGFNEEGGVRHFPLVLLIRPGPQTHLDKVFRPDPFGEGGLHLPGAYLLIPLRCAKLLVKR